MNAEQFLAFADALRSYAQHSGRDLNAANLFVHETLMRALREESPGAVDQGKQRATSDAA
ncbi:MAG: hypothetical protein K2P58_08160 [Hyphomonadaceae bacterium]|nr:hypothetical protein [Hyphomonadaceae bacterium]